jgi:hypothetical protein
MLPYQLVCEGKADEVFFSRLLKASGRQVDVQCPKKDDPNGGLGKAAIHKRLIAFQAQFDKITRVVVLVDSDDDPGVALAEAKEEFNRANTANPAKLYAVPANANTIARLAGSPDTAIAFVPDPTMKGCLDTLLLPSFEQKFSGQLKCVDEFCHCAKDAQRGYTRDLKLRLRILIASAYPKRPGISLANLLEEGHCPIELTHASFDSIRNTLAALFP